METWEYCSIRTFPRGATWSRIGLEIVYYAPDGKHRVEDLKLDPELKPSEDNYRIAFGYALALLGLQGWELVTVEGAVAWAVLKRRVAQPPTG